MSPENVIQILGAIVQAYAGILAIGAGFFTFLVQRFRDELRFAEEKIERNVDIITEVFTPYGMWREATNFKVGAIAHGPYWIDKELNKIYQQGDTKFRLRLSEGHLQAIENLKIEYPRYKKLKQRSKKVPYKLFNGFLLFCSTVIVLSLIAMGFIDVWVLLKISNQVVWFIEGLASAGIIYVSVFAWNITTVFK